MNGLTNPGYLIALIISNIAALVFLVTAVYRSRLARFFFILLFAWACWMNWTTSQNDPAKYLEYADLTFSNFYRDFIMGWFSTHIPLVVGAVAICQGLIAVSLMLKGWIFKLGVIGGIIFLLAILPLGVGAGFPCTLIAAIALMKLYNNGRQYIWQSSAAQPEKYETKTHIPV